MTSLNNTDYGRLTYEKAEDLGQGLAVLKKSIDNLTGGTETGGTLPLNVLTVYGEVSSNQCKSNIFYIELNANTKINLEIALTGAAAGYSYQVVLFLDNKYFTDEFFTATGTDAVFNMTVPLEKTQAASAVYLTVCAPAGVTSSIAQIKISYPSGSGQIYTNNLLAGLNWAVCKYQLSVLNTPNSFDDVPQYLLGILSGTKLYFGRLKSTQFVLDKVDFVPVADIVDFSINAYYSYADNKYTDATVHYKLSDNTIYVKSLLGGSPDFALTTNLKYFDFSYIPNSVYAFMGLYTKTSDSLLRLVTVRKDAMNTAVTASYPFDITQITKVCATKIISADDGAQNVGGLTFDSSNNCCYCLVNSSGVSSVANLGPALSGTAFYKGNNTHIIYLVKTDNLCYKQTYSFAGTIITLLSEVCLGEISNVYEGVGNDIFYIKNKKLCYSRGVF